MAFGQDTWSLELSQRRAKDLSQFVFALICIN